MTTDKTTTANRSISEKEKSTDEVRLALITPGSQGWPEHNLSPRKLKESLENKKYKWAYTNAKYNKMTSTT